MAGALGVVLQLQSKVAAHVGDGGGEGLEVGDNPGGTARHQGHLVVGRHTPVGVEAVEGHTGCCAQRGIEGLGRQVGVGGENNQHGGQARREHPGALGHSPNRPAITVEDRPFGFAVGRHNRQRGIHPAIGGQLGGGDTRTDFVERQLLPDQTGGADEHIARGDTEFLSDGFGGGVGDLEALGSRIAIGPTGVEHNSRDAAIGDHLL